MGTLTKCCCAECDCLSVEDLPSVSITNHTGGGWTGACCFQQVFTPNTTPNWSKYCTDLLYETSVAEQCITEHWRVLGNDYRGYEFFPDGCSELPNDYCCPGGKEKIATTTTNWTWSSNAFMAVWIRPKHIIVQVSREQVDCDGVEGQQSGCKIVIRSRYVYETQSKIYGNSNSTLEQTVQMHNTTCFEVNSDFEISPETPTVITCSDVPASPPASGDCRYFADFYFDRVKYYANMPTGGITFQNTDVPGCNSETCDYSPYNYLTSACIFSPSETSPLGCVSQPCYCYETVLQTNQSFNQGPVVCGFTGDIFELQGCFEEPCNPMLCETVLTNCPDVGRQSYECPNSTYTMNQIGYYMNPENPATCLVQGIGSNGVRSGLIGCGYNRSIEGIGGLLPPYYLTELCNGQPCNSDCCYFIDECPCCFAEGQCLPKYSNEYFSTVITHTRSQSCSGVSQESICTNAPTWTITLA